MIGQVYIMWSPESHKMYVGITKSSIETRLYYHIYDAKRHNRGYNRPKNNWIRKYRNSLQITTLFVIGATDKKTLIDVLYECEIFYIRFLRQNGSILMNYCAGGGGFAAPHSEETKHKLSQIAIGKKRGPYKWTTEGKEAIRNGSKKLIGRKHSLETRNKMSLAQTGPLNTFYGRIPPAALKARAMPIRDARTDIEYRSIAYAAKCFNVSESVIRRLLKLNIFSKL